MTWVHTEADDISGATKPCFKIPCPTPTEFRCDAVGVCLESVILTQRHFPELTAWYLRNEFADEPGFYPPHTASKWAVSGLIKMAALELSRDNLQSRAPTLFKAK